MSKEEFGTVLELELRLGDVVKLIEPIEENMRLKGHIYSVAFNNKLYDTTPDKLCQYYGYTTDTDPDVFEVLYHIPQTES